MLIQVGSSSALSFVKENTSFRKVKNVWTLDSLVDEDLIDEDELLDEEDRVKPDVSSLRGEFKNLYFI